MKCQVIMAGTGGQGVLFVAGLLTEVARRRHENVLGTQSYGVSQRGGSVVAHLKIGAFLSPLVREGAADLLLGFDSLETHRNLPFLRRASNGVGSVCVVNTPNPQAFPDSRVASLLKEEDITVHACDADAIALEIGNPLGANLVLLGFGTNYGGFPFSYEELRLATETLSNPRHAAQNLDALARGRDLRI